MSCRNRHKASCSPGKEGLCSLFSRREGAERVPPLRHMGQLLSLHHCRSRKNGSGKRPVWQEVRQPFRSVSLNVWIPLGAL